MKRVFISFRNEDRNKVNGLRLLAANPDFAIEFYDESVRTAINSANATYIRTKIKEKISRTSVTVCMTSELTHTSQWVDWELEESLAKGNGIIFMGFKDGPANIRLPELGRRLDMKWWLWDYRHLATLIGQ
ncbi:TIR domain-containing protein [Mesorhizobium salmacidum]|uniref:TIR domain-containing protein n=1 Tax=Mesorhizobium salmacidum TaxID=3015171 RepID=A0ABU8L6U0_9HYPH